MTPELPLVELVNVEVLATRDALARGDGMEVEDAPLLRRVLEAGGIVVQDEAHPARLEAREAEQPDQVLIKGRLSNNLVVRGERLRTDKPVVLHAV
jgi:hypothetical protein